MSLNFEGFNEVVQGGNVTITLPATHPLVELAKALPWETLLAIILPDLKRTAKRLWWWGRPLKIRIHLGVYLLQQLFNLTDRQAQYHVHDNAGFRLFCGYGILKKWHVSDHTKIEEFRSRLLPETQRQLANHIAVHATKLKFANPVKLDIDSTIQEANISYPSLANLLVKVAGLAKRLVHPLNQLNANTGRVYHISLKRMKAMLLYYFTLKRQSKGALSITVLQSLWQEVFTETSAVVKDAYQLLSLCAQPKYWNLRRALEQLQWNGYRLLSHLHEELFENKEVLSEKEIRCAPFYALHAYEVRCFNKNKLNKKKQYGRAYQLGRIEGNFAIVTACTSLHMPDAQSLPAVISDHEQLFGAGVLDSVATDKGYYAASNQDLLNSKGVSEISLPRPRRELKAKANPTLGEVQERLHNRRAGIEAIIGHIKHGGQMDRSRMKSDHTTLAAGYASVLGFNLRQLKRHVIGVVRPKFENRREKSFSPPEIRLNSPLTPSLSP